MMDGAAAFLHRRERKAIERRRKGEPLLAMVPVMVGEVPGLLAVTPTRLLHAGRPRRVRVEQLRRRDVAGIRFEKARHGMLLVALHDGGGRRYECMDRRDLAQLQAAMLPAQAKANQPLVRQPSRPHPSGARPSVAHPPTARVGPDPLAHLGTAQHEAKLRRMVAQGTMTKAELDWARGA